MIITYNTAGSALTTGATIHTYYNSGRMKTGRLTSTGTNTTYLHNALGQRIRKTGGTPGTVVFVYDEAGHLLGEYGATGTLVQETIWLGDTPVATIRPNGANFDIFYIHTDHLDQPRKITRPSDNLKRWEFNPNPFGDGAPNENPAALGVFKYHLRFPGQYFDIESNLAYNYFRDYDSAIGRYVESDPVGLRGGINTYGYVGQNPVSKIDPKGLFSSYQHNQITAQAMMFARSDCSSLPQDVALADWLPGSQAPENSHWHAMGDGTNPNETAETARRKYEDFVDQQWKSCTCGGLARALHAVQDSFAGGHAGFQLWGGGVPSPSHVRQDFYPPESARNGAVNATSDLIRKYNQNCQSSCPK